LESARQIARQAAAIPAALKVLVFIINVSFLNGYILYTWERAHREISADLAFNGMFELHGMALFLLGCGAIGARFFS